MCADGRDWMCILYYNKGGRADFDWAEGEYHGGIKYVDADVWGRVYSKYVEHQLYHEDGRWYGYSTTWYGSLIYYPNKQVKEAIRRDNGHAVLKNIYSPEGLLYESMQDFDEDEMYAGSYQQWYVYPSNKDYLPFDPTGHIMTDFVMTDQTNKTGVYTLYQAGGWSDDNGADVWGYLVSETNTASGSLREWKIAVQ